MPAGGARETDVDELSRSGGVEKFRFQGDELDVVRTDDADVAVPLRGLGVDADTQAKQLRRSE
jgi:hypothetical protein